MHHFKLNALRSKKSKLELKAETKPTPTIKETPPPTKGEEEPVKQQPTTTDRSAATYETLDSDPSRAFAVDRAVSPGTIIKGITAVVEVAKDVHEIVQNVQNAKDAQESGKGDGKPNHEAVQDVVDVIDTIGDLIQDIKEDNAPDLGKLDVPPAILRQRRMMQIKAASAGTAGNVHMKAPAKDAPLPPALAKALKHIEIVTARNAPPASGLRRMRAANPLNGSAAAVVGGANTENLPPNLVKALRNIQIAGARTPEGRVLAATAVNEVVGKGAEEPMLRSRVRAATDLEKNDEDEGLPPRLKTSRRRIQIFAASHRGVGGPVPIVKVVEDKDGDEESLPPELEASRRHMQIFEASHGGGSGTPALVSKAAKNPQVVTEEDADESGAAEYLDDVDACTSSVSPADSSKEAAKQTEDGDGESPGAEPGAAPDSAVIPVEEVKDGSNTAAVAPPGGEGPKSVEPSPQTTKPAPNVDPSPPITTNPSSGSKGSMIPTPTDILRYRYHHGTNLGSIYVLEKWLTPSAFPDDSPDDQTSELACVSAWVKEIGLEATAKEFAQRWADAMSDDDWDWLTDEAHANGLRLPVGYFTLGLEFCKGTPFEGFAEVYKSAWGSVKRLLEAAWKKGVGVLIDVHALPGGANTGEHSGTNSHIAGLWGDAANLALATRCVEFIARELKDVPGLIGIQVCNEADWEAKGMYEWYEELVETVARTNSEIALFVSDAWDLEKAVKWVQEKNKVDKKQLNPLVIDTHIYFCFEDEDKALSPQQIIDKVPSTLAALPIPQPGNISSSGATGAIVGEYSCALDPASWGKLDDDSHPGARRKFGATQSKCFVQKTGGSFFWTLKMDWMDGGDWGFVDVTKAGVIVPPVHLAFSKEEVEGRTQNADRKGKLLRGVAGKGPRSDTQLAPPKPKGGQDSSPRVSSRLLPTKHAKRKASQRSMAEASNNSNELYMKGWELGWNDARAFFRARSEGCLPGEGADRIGLKDLWVLKRLRESDIADQGLREYEMGIWKGITDFEEVSLD